MELRLLSILLLSFTLVLSETFVPLSQLTPVISSVKVRLLSLSKVIQNKERAPDSCDPNPCLAHETCCYMKGIWFISGTKVFTEIQGELDAVQFQFRAVVQIWHTVAPILTGANVAGDSHSIVSDHWCLREFHEINRTHRNCPGADCVCVGCSGTGQCSSNINF